MPTMDVRSINDYTFRVIWWLSLLFGVFLMVCFTWYIFRSIQCQDWPTTEGVVEEANMNSGNHPASFSYSYQIAGKNYTGTRLGFAESNDPKVILNRFHVGQKVSVYYNPDDPDLATLETGIHSGTWWSFGCGIFFSLLGLFMLNVKERPPDTSEQNVIIFDPSNLDNSDAIQTKKEFTPSSLGDPIANQTKWTATNKDRLSF